MTVDNAEQHERLIEAMLDCARWPQGGADRVRIDTHISTVVLAGSLAYKIKKPLDLGFLDFVTLASREHACREELRLNRRLAPEVYLDVVAITGTVGRPAIDGEGEVIDWAVRMRRFDPHAVLSEQPGRLDAALVDELATRVAGFHRNEAPAPGGSAGRTLEAVWAPVEQNFRQIREFAGLPVAGLEHVAGWSESQFSGLRGDLAKRADAVRECHGDLHLGNIALIDGRAVVFDAIEFDPALRWIDTVNDIAFLYMDLHGHGRADLANRFVDRYMQELGDYGGLVVLRFYAVYRAMVRAKIAAIRSGQLDDAGGRQAAIEEVTRYVALAGTLTQRGAVGIVITHGVSGSGKSYAAASLADVLPTVCLRSDVERKRLLGLAATDAATAQGGYTAELTARTYDRLAQLAGTVVAAGYLAVVDATFLRRSQRERFRDLARQLAVPFLVLDCDAEPAVLRQRIVARRADHKNVSDADLSVLERQLAGREPLTEAERACSIHVTPGTPVDLKELAVRLGR
ncbi:MAG: AAA family ATPase [Gammaproteobacteria bacterium]|nr:AAA family ATPase [Gammaproteobacteria bacterium]